MTWARAFWQGATRPSLPALLGTLAVTSLVWGTAAARVQPAWVASGAFVVEHDDDYARVAMVSARLAARGAPAGPVVALLGTSALREAVPDPYAVARAARSAEGAPSVIPLVAAALTPLEMVALADALPQGLHGVAVVELSERNLAVGAAEYARARRIDRLPISSAAEDALARELGLAPPSITTGNYFIDHVAFFLARPKAARTWFGDAPDVYWWHQVDGLPPPSEADWRRLTGRLAGWLHAPEATLAANEQVYTALVGLLRDRGLDVVFVASPRNPGFLARVDATPELAAARAANRARLMRLAETLGAPLWYVGDEVHVQAPDFKDYTHLYNPVARDRYARRLGARLAERLAAPSGGTP